MQFSSSQRVATILLAAGGSTRMGRPKALIRDRGRSLVRGACERALQSRADASFVVVGEHADAIRAELADLQVVVLVADAWRDGLSGSIRCGVDAVSRCADPAFDFALLMLADQPEITVEHLDALIEQCRTRSIAATEYAGTLGVPAIFARRHFDALTSLTGDRGAKALLLADPETGRVPFENAAIDIDTPGDLMRR